TACGSGGGEGGGGETTDDLTLGTGGTSGTYYPLGGELATIFESNVDGVTVNYVESGASAENLGKIYQGEWQMGFTQSDTANDAVNGELEDLDGTELDNVAGSPRSTPRPHTSSSATTRTSNRSMTSR